MTYWLLNAIFLGIVAVVAVATVLRRRSPNWRAVGLAGIPLLVLTAVFDNVLVALGIVGYHPDRISGVLVGVAPLEDFSYAVAALVLLPCLWELLRPSRRGAARRSSGTDVQ
jgi:lycopene cyclase domain-containing protein